MPFRYWKQRFADRQPVSDALAAGYRLIDTVAAYFNMEEFKVQLEAEQNGMEALRGHILSFLPAIPAFLLKTTSESD